MRAGAEGQVEALWITDQLAAAAGAGVALDDFASPLVFDVDEVSLDGLDALDESAVAFFSPLDEPEAARLSVR